MDACNGSHLGDEPRSRKRGRRTSLDFMQHAERVKFARVTPTPHLWSQLPKARLLMNLTEMGSWPRDSYICQPERLVQWEHVDPRDPASQFVEAAIVEHQDNADQLYVDEDGEPKKWRGLPDISHNPPVDNNYELITAWGLTVVLHDRELLGASLPGSHLQALWRTQASALLHEGGVQHFMQSFGQPWQPLQTYCPSVVEPAGVLANRQQATTNRQAHSQLTSDSPANNSTAQPTPRIPFDSTQPFKNDMILSVDRQLLTELKQAKAQHTGATMAQLIQCVKESAAAQQAAIAGSTAGAGPSAIDRSTGAGAGGHPTVGAETVAVKAAAHTQTGAKTAAQPLPAHRGSGTAHPLQPLVVGSMQIMLHGEDGTAIDLLKAWHDPGHDHHDRAHAVIDPVYAYMLLWQLQYSFITDYKTLWLLHCPATERQKLHIFGPVYAEAGAPYEALEVATEQPTHRGAVAWLRTQAFEHGLDTLQAYFGPAGQYQYEQGASTAAASSYTAGVEMEVDLKEMDSQHGFENSEQRQQHLHKHGMALSVELVSRICIGNQGSVMRGYYGGVPAVIKLFMPGSELAYQREVKAYQRMQHVQGQFIPCLLGHGMLAPATRFIAMKAVDGKTLESIRRRGIPADMMAAALKALDGLHATPGFLHGDLHLGNIMVDNSTDATCVLCMFVDLGRSRLDATDEEQKLEHQDLQSLLLEWS